VAGDVLDADGADDGAGLVAGYPESREVVRDVC
jgi:hypothetical protein